MVIVVDVALIAVVAGLVLVAVVAVVSVDKYCDDVNCVVFVKSMLLVLIRIYL